MNYTLISSSFTNTPFRQEFAKLWYANLARADVRPKRVVIIAQGETPHPMLGKVGPETDIITCPGDLGHIGQHLNGQKKFEFTGWSAAMLAGMLIAYNSETDALYLEEDALAYGPWVSQAYRDLGDGQIVYGPKHTSAPWMSCSQSLFLVRHAFIPRLVRDYLALGRDGDPNNLGELKFTNLEKNSWKKAVRHLSFGVDRMRPIPWDAPVWYAQQWKQEELDEARARGFI